MSLRILHVLDHSIPLHSGYTFRTLSILREQRKRTVARDREQAGKRLAADQRDIAIENQRDAGSGKLRQRLLDPRAFNRDTIMPAYGRSDGFNRPAPGVAGRPVLTPQQVEDVVAWLATLR